ncbi:MAG TPA: CoA transferase [Gemmatimonadaceae bacterium]|nr:CoA transferase [Gemmatimonadaceae bacterium]
MRLKVVDLSRVLAGPVCSMILGDLGADVIKVEKPGEGDETRGWGPPFNADGQSAYFLSVNRNKKSIALDLSQAGDQGLLRSLIAGGDVVLENFLPGSLEKLGVSADELLRAHPKLIWCTISAFGGGSRRPGYDFVVQAESGWMAITGEKEGEPMKVGVALSDVIAGKDAAIAILAKVREVSEGDLSPEQRHVAISLVGSARASLVNVAQNVLVSGRDAKRWGNAHPNLVPYQLFTASDRPFVIAVGSDSQWSACAAALELSDLAVDAALRTNAGRVTNRDRVVDAIARRVIHEQAEKWVERLASVGVPCGIVHTVAEALAGAEASEITGVPPSVPGTIRLPPPSLDEHGAAIRSMGWRAFQR